MNFTKLIHFLNLVAFWLFMGLAILFLIPTVLFGCLAYVADFLFWNITEWLNQE